jgi:hypothetical protein
MLKDGTYVRFVEVPNTRMGTVSEGTQEAGKEKYRFHHDERFIDSISDLYVFDYDIEECQRPSDAEVATINALIRRGT